jgi:hypothetical protein
MKMKVLNKDFYLPPSKKSKRKIDKELKEQRDLKCQTIDTVVPISLQEHHIST